MMLSLLLMYALSVSAEGDCYLCVPLDPGIEAAALGAVSLLSLVLRLLMPCTPLHLTQVLHAVSFATAPPSLLSLHLYRSDKLSPPGAQSFPVPSLFSRVRRSMPPLPPSPAPPCLPCVKGRQCAAPHSSSFPPTTAPLQTLHMDMWGPARVNGQGRECYFLLVVDDYTHYTTVFPLRSKGEVSDDLIPWIRAVRLQLCERFGQVLPVLRLHSDRGGEFSSDLLREFFRGECILQSLTLVASL
ncbi:unnamed protein product [Closterium sp. NIES-54]